MPKPIPFDSGVYLIKNTVSGKFYVGSSGTLSERLRSHLRMLRRNDHDNRHLQHSWNKHGEDKFEFSVLETCHPEKCIEREQHWIDKLRAVELGYNVCPVAESRRGAKLREETKRQMSISHTGVPKGPCSEETKRKIGEANEGLKGPRPAWVTAKIVAAQKGKKRGPMSAETRKRMSQSAKGRPKSEEHKAAIRAAVRATFARRRLEIAHDVGVEQPGSSTGS